MLDKVLGASSPFPPEAEVKFKITAKIKSRKDIDVHDPPYLYVADDSMDGRRHMRNTAYQQFAGKIYSYLPANGKWLFNYRLNNMKREIGQIRGLKKVNLDYFKESWHVNLNKDPC